LLILVFIEYWAMVGSVYIGHLVRFSWGEWVLPELDTEVWQGHIYAVVNILSMIALGAYRPHTSEGVIGSLLRSMVAIFLSGTTLISLSFYLVPSQQTYFGRGVLAITSVVALTLVAVIRSVFHRISDVAAWRWQVLVIGAGNKALRLSESLAVVAGEELHLVGFWPVSEHEYKVPSDTLVNYSGTLQAFCLQNKIQELVVAVDERRRSDESSFPLDDLLDCKLNGISVIDDLSFLERESGRLDIRSLSPGWLVFSDGFSFSPLRDYLERGFDLIASAALLLVTWPFMLLAAVSIKLEEGVRAPLIYSQERVGYGGRIIRVHKFRSMRIDAEKDGKAVWAQKNDSRVTRVGAFIRNTRIDELPQIFNVFKGDMSFVGPRPERPQFVDELAQQIPYYRERHRVKPGITGWAQLCYPYGASVLDAEEKLKYDLYYIKNHSLMFDLYILVRTVEVILLGNGVR
jgi:sugar transferase (PEP-CTERM system associated)